MSAAATPQKKNHGMEMSDLGIINNMIYYDWRTTATSPRIEDVTADD